MWLVSVTRSQVWMGSRCVKFGVFSLLLYWSLKVQHGTSMQRTPLRIWTKSLLLLHKDGVGYKKIANTLKLSCSTVFKSIQRFNRTGSTQNRPRHGRPKKLSLGIASEVEGVWAGGVSACQCSDHTPHTASWHFHQALWWECHGLGLHECCRHWGDTVHWGNHKCQHVLWHTEAEHDPLPSETGPQGSIPTW